MHMNITPAINEFRNVSQEYSHIPIFMEISGDLDTPISLYLKVRDISPYSFLLESALQSGASGRYSFIGFNPEKIITCSNGKITVMENGASHREDRKPLPFLRSLLNAYTIPKLDTLNCFSGGLVGYFAYDYIRAFERIPDSHSSEIDCDDFVLMLMETVIVYDHFRHTIRIITLAECSDSPDDSYRRASQRLHSIKDMLVNRVVPAEREQESGLSGSLDIRVELLPEEFENMVRSAQEYILKGDIFQIVLSQRFSIPITVDSFKLFRSLRKLNPSPYMFYLALDDTVITGSSPEVLVKAQGGVVTTRPLAGTRRRGGSPLEDRQTAAELLADEKECAEHIMLVDLGRNDLGRFCKFGSIHVPEFMGIEYFSHVMHIVSEVTGQLCDDRDCFDILRGCFPAGTVSGAPKIRAMELIDKLEKSRRGFYAGAVGHFDFYNNMDTCITIRTLLVKDSTAYIQAGAGIVADSVPGNEYQETLNKAQVLIMAIADAEGKSYDSYNR